MLADHARLIIPYARCNGRIVRRLTTKLKKKEEKKCHREKESERIRMRKTHLNTILSQFLSIPLSANNPAWSENNRYFKYKYPLGIAIHPVSITIFRNCLSIGLWPAAPSHHRSAVRCPFSPHHIKSFLNLIHCLMPHPNRPERTHVVICPVPCQTFPFAPRLETIACKTKGGGGTTAAATETVSRSHRAPPESQITLSRVQIVRWIVSNKTDECLNWMIFFKLIQSQFSFFFRRWLAWPAAASKDDDRWFYEEGH